MHLLDEPVHILLRRGQHDHFLHHVGALPDVPGYRGLVEKVLSSLVTLRIRVLFVGRDGAVRSPAES